MDSNEIQYLIKKHVHLHVFPRILNCIRIHLHEKLCNESMSIVFFQVSDRANHEECFGIIYIFSSSTLDKVIRYYKNLHAAK